MPTNSLNQISQLWSRLTARQRVVVVGGTLLTLLALFAAVKVFGSPEYKPLMVGLEPADVQTISAQLAAKKIPLELTPDGKGINVAADQLDAARLEVASAGSTHSGRMGFELFDKSSWGQTEFDEKVNYQRALEGELERTIGTLNGVKSARVHLVMPTSSVFLDRARSGKASVTLQMKRGSLSPDQLSAIARLVSGAVDDLAPRDVTIIDADSNESLGSKSAGTMEGRELEAALTQRLLSTLSPAVGADNLRASVNVEYDLTSSEENQDKYDPAVSAVLSSQKSQEQIGSAAAPGGVAGTAANLPNTGSTQASTLSDDNAQTSSSDNSTFGVNKVVRHTVSPAGRIRRITAAILVNDASDRKQVKGQWVATPRKRTQPQLDQLAELARGVLGVDKERGDIVTVQNMTFDDESTPLKPPSLADTMGTRLAQFSTPLRYGAMLLLFFLVWALMFRPVQKQLAATAKEIGPGVSDQPLLDGAPALPELTAALASVSLESNPETAQIKRELNDLVLAEPASMTRTLQTWLRESNG